MKKIEIEDEIAKILQQEIWNEIEKETGETQQDLDNLIIGKIEQIHHQNIIDSAVIGIIGKIELDE